MSKNRVDLWTKNRVDFCRKIVSIFCDFGRKIKSIVLSISPVTRNNFETNGAPYNICSGNVHASDCGSAHCNGCVFNGIFAKTAC